MKLTNHTEKICSFTGYRQKKLKACLSNSSLTERDVEECLRARMLEMIDEGFSVFRCGMASGSDLMFARIALELKRTYPLLVKFIAVIPCLNHDKNWREDERTLLREITEQADEAIIVSNSPYFDGCMAKRNRFLVQGCDELLAIFSGQPGGTMQTINFAKGSGIKVTIINPAKEVIITLRDSNTQEKPIRA